MSAGKPVDPNILSRFIPIGALNPENFRKLAESIFVEQAGPGAVLFREGDTDNYSVYLISGEVALTSTRSAVSRTVVGGSDAALYALANLKPRQFTGTVKSPIGYIRLDSGMLDKLLTWDQVAGIEVTEFGSADDDVNWMMKLLQTNLFLRLPSANIQSLFERFEEMPMKSGQIVIKQGDKGDYFYIIKHGRCRVVRKHDQKTASVALADLEEGDGFGEDALLSDAPRNATIAALTDGTLMRLAKDDFDALLKEPLLQRIGQAEAAAMVAIGAVLIDVRLEDEYKKANIDGSINIPLYLLRTKAERLNRSLKYVTYCDTGNRSAAAAYLLSGRGFDAYVLTEGWVALLEATAARSPQ